MTTRLQSEHSVRLPPHLHHLGQAGLLLAGDEGGELLGLVLVHAAVVGLVVADPVTSLRVRPGYSGAVDTRLRPRVTTVCVTGANGEGGTVC